MKINVAEISKKFFKILGNLNEEQWKMKVNNNWTIKDVVSHLFGWVFDEGEDNHYLFHLNQIKKVLEKKDRNI